MNVANNSSEHKIDLIQEQLSALQQTVQEITKPLASVPSPPCQVSSTPAFEGQSLFNSETRLARDAAYSAVVLQEPNDDVSAALATLKHSLDKHNQTNTQAREAESSGEQPLPVNFVVAVVRKIKGEYPQSQVNNTNNQAQPPFCLVSHSWRDYLQVESLCQSIYFPSDPIPAGSVTLLHGLLYFIIRDYLHEDDSDLARFDAAGYCKLCEDRFVTGLKNFEMMTDPTLEKLQALLLGVC